MVPMVYHLSVFQVQGLKLNLQRVAQVTRVKSKPLGCIPGLTRVQTEPPGCISGLLGLKVNLQGVFQV